VAAEDAHSASIHGINGALLLREAIDDAKETATAIRGASTHFPTQQEVGQKPVPWQGPGFRPKALEFPAALLGSISFPAQAAKILEI